MSFSTGRGSPLIIASSTLDMPSTTTPSIGIFCPGFTKRISPTCISSIGMVLSSPSTIIIASLACSFMRSLTASLVLYLALASNHLPRVMKNIMNTAASKNTFTSLENSCGKNVTAEENAHEVNVLKATKLSILNDFFFNAFHALMKNCFPPIKIIPVVNMN